MFRLGFFILYSLIYYGFFREITYESFAIVSTVYFVVLLILDFCDGKFDKKVTEE
jgi:phosphatidylglycerophosphate synthase